jgi:hypothetical protein
MCLLDDQAACITCHRQYCLCLLLYLLDSQYCTTAMKTLRRKKMFSAVEGIWGVEHSQSMWLIRSFNCSSQHPYVKTGIKLGQWWCYSGLWSRVHASVDTNVLEKHTVSMFRAEDGDSMFLRNVGFYRQVYTAPKPRITSSSPPWKPQISQIKTSLFPILAV